MAIDFEYAQARVQARLGERLDASGWQLLETSRDLGQYLHAARGTVLASRVEPLSATASPHFIERTLRREWRREVAITERWVPGRWRTAVAWMAHLCDLPALQWLARGSGVLPWISDDEALSPFAHADSSTRAGELTAAGLGPLVERDDLAAAWLTHFQSTWPDDGSATMRLRTFVDHIETYRARSAVAELTTAAQASARDRLEARAVRLIRRSLAEPVTVFAHLLLVALDLERLRSGLVRRALFNGLEAA